MRIDVTFHPASTQAVPCAVTRYGPPNEPPYHDPSWDCSDCGATLSDGQCINERCQPDELDVWLAWSPPWPTDVDDDDEPRSCQVCGQTIAQADIDDGFDRSCRTCDDAARNAFDRAYAAERAAACTLCDNGLIVWQRRAVQLLTPCTCALGQAQRTRYFRSE